MGQKQKRMTERVTELGRRTREETEKWDQTDSPEIPDTRETSNNSQPPFRGRERESLKLFKFTRLETLGY